jgi:RNA polymerase sigma-70 factor (ECF subfamily)
MSSDNDVIAAFLAGDPTSVGQVRQWIKLAFKGYRQSLGGEFEDLEQEILLELTRDLKESRFRGGSSLGTYVRTYVHHKCIDRLRAGRRRTFLQVEELDLAAPSPSVLESLTGAERVEIALRVAAEMPELCRQLWHMLTEGLSYREMSDRLGWTEGALRARVLRCRRRALEIRRRLSIEDEDGRQ